MIHRMTFGARPPSPSNGHVDDAPRFQFGRIVGGGAEAASGGRGALRKPSVGARKDAWRRGPTPACPALPEGEVHVFVAWVDAPPDADALAWLSPDERERAGRFHFERDRLRFAAARGHLRILLGSYLGMDPSALRFAYGPQGKPALSGDANARRLRFNVSHSGGLALFALTADREVGVDCEQLRPVAGLEAIAERHFSPRERAQLRRVAEPEKPRAFLRAWTRKEAFIKCTGEGASRRLDSFDVTLLDGEPARLFRVEQPAAARWWLEDLEPAAGYAAALVVQGHPARVSLMEIEVSQRDGRKTNETRS